MNETQNFNCCSKYTPLVISKITDLSSNLPDNEKYIIIVTHSDGSVEEFLIGPLRTFTSQIGIWPIPDNLLQ